MSNHASGNHDPRSPGNQPDWDAIARYLAGESSPEESASVQLWLEANPADKALVQQLDTTASLEAAPVDVEAALTRVHREMGRPEKPQLVVERGGATRGGGVATRFPMPARIAGIAAIAAAAAAAFVSVGLLDRSSPSKPGDGSNEGRTYATAVGKRDSIALVDGSHVILGPDSRLIVPGDYGATVRSVELHGDAYFDIKHDSAKPFTVRVGRALVEDIGTTFAVESDAGDTTTVAVITGSVRLRAANAGPTGGTVLAAGDRGSMAADGEVHAYPHTVADDASWTTGHIVLKEVSLARVAGEIHRWYGVDLHVADTAMLKLHVTTTFNSDDPIDQTLKVIGLMLGANVERQGNRATLSPAGAPAVVR